MFYTQKFFRIIPHPKYIYDAPEEYLATPKSGEQHELVPTPAEMSRRMDLSKILQRDIRNQEYQCRIDDGETPDLLQASLMNSFDYPGSILPNIGNKVSQIRSDIPNYTEYTIKSGDSLSVIAKSYGLSVADIQKLNPDISDINKIKVGQKLKLTGEKRENIATVVPRQKPNKVETMTTTPIEKPKTLQEQLDQAKADLAKTAEIVTAVSRSGDTVVTQKYREELTQRTQKVAELQSKVSEQDKQRVALEAYNKLTPNQKILQEYQAALKKAQDTIGTTPINSPDRAVLNAQILELGSQVRTSENLVKNDKKIAEINASIAEKAAYLRQTGDFAYKTEKLGEIAKIQSNNTQLLASLNAGAIKPQTLLAARMNQFAQTT